MQGVRVSFEAQNGKEPCQCMLPPSARLGRSTQPAPMLAGVRLGGREFPRPVEPHVPPSKALADLLKVDEAVTNENPSDLSAAAVHVDHLDADDLAEHFGGQVLPRFCPERLALFGGVDAVQADLVLHIGVVEHGQRVTVSNRTLSGLADFLQQVANLLAKPSIISAAP